MELNADFSRRAVVHAAREPWIPSPTVGVDRRMLDRLGGEVARATSIVRYAPDSRFPAHVHGGGEEILVLEGVFSDEHGDYPAGSYLRNPPTSSHSPGSQPGCVIFVKLWQFDPAARAGLRVEADGAAFAPSGRSPGVEVAPLFRDEQEDVRLERWAPGCDIELAVQGGLEALVLDGGFTEGGDDFEPHSWLRLPARSVLRAKAGPNGARVWIKTGHLVRPPAAPPGA